MVTLKNIFTYLIVPNNSDLIGEKSGLKTTIVAFSGERVPEYN